MASARLPINLQPPPTQKPERERGENGRNQHPFRLVGSEEKWRSAGAGAQGGASDPAFAGPWSRRVGCRGRRRAIATRSVPPPSSTHPNSPRGRAGFAFPFRPLTEIRAGRGGRAWRGWAEGGEAGRKRKGRAASWLWRGVQRAACVRRRGGRAGGEKRAGGGGMRARGASRPLLRLDGKSRAQPERSIKMAAASAVAAASGR